MFNEIGGYWDDYISDLNSRIPKMINDLAGNTYKLQQPLRKLVELGFNAHIVVFLPSPPLNDEGHYHVLGQDDDHPEKQVFWEP